MEQNLPKDLRRCFANKNIFITGASGFLGVCLLEKICRTIPDHGKIYLLLRPKRGKEVKERLEEIKKNSVFEKLYEDKSVETVFAKVEAVAGDVGTDDLGLSAADKQTLTENVNFIFHCAATLDFGETLKSTTNINLLGTRRTVKLAEECSNLNAFVHVSSAYVNSWRLSAEEILYPVKVSAEELISTVNKLSDEELEKKQPEILGDHPNTYTITKHLAEHEIDRVKEAFPCTIVRPSMIMGAWKEPVPGWTVSKNGPAGFFMGAAKGVVRRLPVGKELVYDYIPVDLVVNTMLAAGFYVSYTKPKTLSIYHATSSTRNPFKWIDVEDQINHFLHKYPLKSAVWYPHLKLLPSVAWFKISAFFVHFIPAIILDTVTRVTGGRPILVKLHRNVNTSLDRLNKFIFTEWQFSATNTTQLQSWLSEQDQNDFNMEIKKLDWKEFFVNTTIGARVYLNKEPMKNLKGALGKDKVLYFVHMIWQSAIFSLLWYIFACIFGMSMTQAVFIVPVLYGLYCLL